MNWRGHYTDFATDVPWVKGLLRWITIDKSLWNSQFESFMLLEMVQILTGLSSCSSYVSLATVQDVDNTYSLVNVFIFSKGVVQLDRFMVITFCMISC